MYLDVPLPLPVKTFILFLTVFATLFVLVVGLATEISPFGTIIVSPTASVSSVTH